MKIKSIHKEEFTGTVYNFHCTPDENYFSENICVHNCYKCNGTQRTPTKHMTLETFKKILDKFVSQVVIELEDGRKLRVSPTDKIKLTNGSEKLAVDLCDGDEIGV